MKFQPRRPIGGEYSRNHWEFLDFPPETTVPDLLDPVTWAHVARQWFKPLDEITVIPQSAPFMATFIVMDKGMTWAKLKLLEVHYLNADEVEPVEEVDDKLVVHLPDNAPVSVEWKGPNLKWSVLRTADKEKLKTGFSIKTEAEAWAAEHLLAMA